MDILSECPWKHTVHDARRLSTYKFNIYLRGPCMFPRINKTLHFKSNHNYCNKMPKEMKLKECKS